MISKEDVDAFRKQADEIMCAISNLHDAVTKAVAQPRELERQGVGFEASMVCNSVWLMREHTSMIFKFLNVLARRLDELGGSDTPKGGPSDNNTGAIT